jgi:hypothetical protein
MARISLSLSPTRTLVTPYCKRTRPGRGTNTKAAGFPFTPVSLWSSPLRAPSHADPSGLGHAATIYSSVQGPPGVETPTLFTIVTIHQHYSSSLLFVDDIYSTFFVVTIHHYYSLLLFIDHPITPNFYYSSIMLSSPPKTSQTHILVIRTPVTVIFLPVGNFPSGHPSQVSPS